MVSLQNSTHFYVGVTSRDKRHRIGDHTNSVDDSPKLKIRTLVPTSYQISLIIHQIFYHLVKALTKLQKSSNTLFTRFLSFSQMNKKKFHQN